MLGNAKKLREIKQQIKKNPCETDADGNAVINMRIKKGTAFLSPFCIDKPMISSELANYLDTAAKVLPIGKAITLRVFSEGITPDEEPACVSAIKNYYSNRLCETSISAKKNTALYSFMAIIGISLSFILFFMSKLAVNQIIRELLTILSWVFIWESIDLFVFDRPILNYELQRSLSFVTAKVEFIPFDKQACADKQPRSAMLIC